VLQGTEGAVVAPHSGASDAADDDTVTNPTDFLLVLAPVYNDQGPQGIVEVFQRPGARVATQRGYLRFVLQICEYAGDFLKSRRLRHLAEKQTLWEQLETFTRTAHEKLDVRQTAYTIANEGRRLIGCDRVSVAISRGGRCYIEAVSGQDTFDKRSNVTVLLGKLATAVAKTGEDVWYSGDTSDMAPQVEQALDAYVDEANTKAMAILPLVQPGSEDPVAIEQEQAEDIYRKPPPVLGAIIVEQMVDSRPPEGFLQRVQVVRGHSATALANALEFEGLFLMPLWRLLGKSTSLFRGRTLPKTLLVTALVLGAVAAACFVKTDFTLEAEGRLRPKLRQNVYAQLDGDVQEVLIEHNSEVTQGQPLVVQRSLDLDKQWEEVNGQLLQTEADIESTSRELIDSAELSEADKNQKVAHVAQLQQRAISLREQRRLLSIKKDMLEVRSPINGRIVSWKVKEHLQGLPVRRGELLMEVADPTGDWELELTMQESRMGHIAKAWKDTDGDLQVEFILATHPGDKLAGRVQEIHRSAEVRQEQGNTVLLQVAFDQQTLREIVDDPKIGAGVTAKVYCGRESIGYVWLHDLIDFVRSKILFRF
jgi:multidrug efflux pump subunit AcrA (membrane-fusion protein)